MLFNNRRPGRGAGTCWPSRREENEQLGDDLTQSMGEALAYVDGTGDPKNNRVHVPNSINVRATRSKLRSQAKKASVTKKK
jgi:hypothetical protein